MFNFKEMSDKVDKIISGLNDQEKLILHCRLNYEFVKKDVVSMLEGYVERYGLTEEQENYIADKVSTKYAIDQDYDCTVSYVDNLDEFIRISISELRG